MLEQFVSKTKEEYTEEYRVSVKEETVTETDDMILHHKYAEGKTMETDNSIKIQLLRHTE